MNTCKHQGFTSFCSWPGMAVTSCLKFLTLTSLKWWTTTWNSKANRPLLFLYPIGCFWSENFITATGRQIWQPSMRRKDFQSSDQQTSSWKCVHLSTSWLWVIDSLERKIRLWTTHLNKMLRTKSVLDFRFFSPKVWRIQIHNTIWQRPKSRYEIYVAYRNTLYTQSELVNKRGFYCCFRNWVFSQDWPRTHRLLPLPKSPSARIPGRCPQTWLLRQGC